MPRILLLLPTRTYRAQDFMEAASRLHVEVVVVSEEPSTMQELRPGALLTVDFLRPEEAADKAVAFYRRYPFQAVVPVDEETAVTAAAIAQAVGLPYNSPEAATAARLKHLMRDKLQKAGVPVPAHRLVSLDEEPGAVASELTYPSVLKPIFLSSSQGVMRVNDPQQFVSAFRRLTPILEAPEVRHRGGEWARTAMIERYLPGVEVAVEGLLTDGRLRVLAIFDKPDPLEGPFFQETLYVTPSRLPAAEQDAVVKTTSVAARALGLRTGPVHAELRIHRGGPWVIEIAGRSIGGLCSRTLRFGLGVSLEELLLRHALGKDVKTLSRERDAAGVMMIPVARSGRLRGVDGLAGAKAVPGVEGVTITAHIGQQLNALPEGSTYLGFIFARASTPRAVEAALRSSHARLSFSIE